MAYCESSRDSGSIATDWPESTFHFDTSEHMQLRQLRLRLVCAFCLSHVVSQSNRLSESAKSLKEQDRNTLRSQPFSITQGIEERGIQHQRQQRRQQSVRVRTVGFATRTTTTNVRFPTPLYRGALLHCAAKKVMLQSLAQLRHKFNCNNGAHCKTQCFAAKYSSCGSICAELSQQGLRLWTPLNPTKRGAAFVGVY
jgi:hypothetical protein